LQGSPKAKQRKEGRKEGRTEWRKGKEETRTHLRPTKVSESLQEKATSSGAYGERRINNRNAITLSLKCMLRGEGVGCATYILPMSDFIIGDF